jgi:hypothetical protein
MALPKCSNCDEAHAINYPSEPFRDCLYHMRTRIARTMLHIAGQPVPCDACNAPIYFVVHANGKRTPYTVTGLSHFIDCPASADFKGGRKR